MLARFRSWYLESLTRCASSSRLVLSTSGAKCGFVYKETSRIRGCGLSCAGTGLSGDRAYALSSRTSEPSRCSMEGRGCSLVGAWAITGFRVGVELELWRVEGRRGRSALRRKGREAVLLSVVRENGWASSPLVLSNAPPWGLFSGDGVGDLEDVWVMVGDTAIDLLLSAFPWSCMSSRSSKELGRNCAKR